MKFKLLELGWFWSQNFAIGLNILFGIKYLYEQIILIYNLLYQIIVQKIKYPNY